ncbi:type IV secretory pathway ATPase VirB11/archaellum biosynthesis ATPase [Sphingomonas sp. BE270]|jgi:type IV secretion system protein VirB11|uniref:hypothetical protein n=1 Tax=unclassified Sphingomonas TaxID=196159 RepID=UPI001BB136FE|nr:MULTISPECIES: hypothetical protein [unclassified Sphingomonas]MDR7258522.1 type IV secretory pathway ATPase VirB11/archaellum biosynthesis ATPase [Sphingomonas sp. BE270]
MIAFQQNLEIPADERLIPIEDTPELRFNHSNAIGLLASRGALGEARVSTDDLLGASPYRATSRVFCGLQQTQKALPL